MVPQLAEKLAAQLNRKKLTFQALETAKYPLLDRAAPIGEPSPLINRIEEETVAKLILPVDAAKPAAPKKAEKPEAKAAPQAPAGPPPEIEYADFAKVSLKAGKVLAAEKVPKADKLLKLSIELGEGAPRTIVSGIAEAYAPEAVVGKTVVVVTNLKPRALKGIESRGMILTAGSGGKDLVLLDPGAGGSGHGGEVSVERKSAPFDPAQGGAQVQDLAGSRAERKCGYLALDSVRAKCGPPFSRARSERLVGLANHRIRRRPFDSARANGDSIAIR